MEQRNRREGRTLTTDPSFVLTLYGDYSTEEIEKLEDRLQHLLTGRELNGYIESPTTHNLCAIHKEEYYKKLFGD
jgi:hypothetical protein